MNGLKLTRFDDVFLQKTSVHIPTARLSTDALAVELGLDAGAAAELVRLTGVVSRPVAPPEHATSDLVAAALAPLLAPDLAARLDRLVVATVTPDHPSPATAPLVQHRLGLPHLPAFDLSAACAGFVFALDLAARALVTGDRAVLVAAGECRVRTLDRAAPGVRVLFSDGAAAALLTRDPPAPGALRLVATGLSADGSGHDAIRVAAGGSRLPTSEATVAAGLHALAMSDGPHVFMKATEAFVQLADAFLGALSLSLPDIALVVPHQPNVRILERVARLLRLPRERLVVTCDTLGNTGGASAAIALHLALTQGRIAPGDKVLILTAGAGYTAGAALLEAPPHEAP